MAEFSKKIKIIASVTLLAGLLAAGFFALKYTRQYFVEKNKEKVKQEIGASRQDVFDGNFSESVKRYRALVKSKQNNNAIVSNSVWLELSIAEINSEKFNSPGSKKFSKVASRLTKLAFNTSKSIESAMVRQVALCRLAEMTLLTSQGDQKIISEMAGLENIKAEDGDFYKEYGNLLVASVEQNSKATVSYQLASLYAQNLATQNVAEDADEKMTELLKDQAIEEFKRAEDSSASIEPDFRLNPDRQFLSYLYKGRAIYLLDQAGVDMAANGLPGKEEAEKYFQKALGMKEDKWLSANPQNFEYLARLYYAMYLSSQKSAVNVSVSSMLSPIYEKRIDGRMSVYNLLAKESIREKKQYDVQEIMRLAKEDDKFRQLLVELGWKDL